MKHELDARTNHHGELISLVWDPVTGVVELELRDDDGVVRIASVPPSRALEAFRHPYLFVDPTCLPAVAVAA